ncbi:MAG: hypothetical protein ABSB11_07650 [Sedimentisphaerales bacterium]|jgi:hypothetical protein
MKAFLSKILVVVVMILMNQCALAMKLKIGTPVPVPGWKPNPNSDQLLTYISPNADFMLVTTHNWPNRRIASRTWNPTTSQWDSPVYLGFPADSSGGYLSANRKTLFYQGDGGGYRSHWIGSSWAAPGECISTSIGRGAAVWWPMFTGSKLYFSSDSDKLGDFWVSDYNPTTDQFSQATKIDAINSSYRENTIWVSSDGQLMLFSSNRPGGYGGDDIYSAIWDESSHTWGNIENLGPGINTSKDERFARVAENAGLLFFTRASNDTEERTLMQAPFVIIPEGKVPRSAPPTPAQ